MPLPRSKIRPKSKAKAKLPHTSDFRDADNLLKACREDNLGSVSALQALVLLAIRPDCPEQLYERTLDLLMFLLEPQRAITTESASRALVVTLSFMSIQGITILFEEQSEERQQKAVARISRSWPGIWAWVQFLFKEVVSSLEQAMDFRMKTCKTVVCFLDVMSSHEHLRSLLSSNKAVVSMMLSIWALGADAPLFHYRSLGIFVARPFLTAFRDLLSGPRFDYDEYIISPMGSVNSIVKTALKYAREELSQSPVDPRDACACISVLHALSDHEPFLYESLAQNAVGVASQLLYQVASVPANSDRDEVVFAIHEISRYLAFAADTIDGSTWVLQAVEAQLLPTLLKASRWLPRSLLPQHEVYLCLLTEILPKYLVYISIIRAVTKAIAVVEHLGLEDSLDRASDLWKAWASFKDYASSRVEAKDGLERSLMEVFCSNKQCPRGANAGNLRAYMRCGSCNRAQYCSKDCQKYHWTSGGHKASCRLWEAPQRGQGPSPLSMQDTTYLVKVAQRDLRTRAQEIVDARKAQRLKVPLVIIDYRFHPFKLSVCPLSSVTDNGDPLPSQWDRMLQSASGYGPYAVIYRAIVPAGQNGRRYTGGFIRIGPELEVEEVVEGTEWVKDDVTDLQKRFEEIGVTQESID
ncbi:hypothetical protein BV22DRAFT_1126643 [Leucogyrophana mollusca]|uniref:Uncharacterized protein n=1 Tax=Leucogyrophana mollusca TaxID=85980 RepID=A0ACB8BSF6_9AGAM|nr:hypothetical protein BV22DRAFT_1126643 [Leucogyrophana mollusca]